MTIALNKYCIKARKKGEIPPYCFLRKNVKF